MVNCLGGQLRSRSHLHSAFDCGLPLSSEEVLVNIVSFASVSLVQAVNKLEAEKWTKNLNELPVR